MKKRLLIVVGGMSAVVFIPMYLGKLVIHLMGDLITHETAMVWPIGVGVMGSIVVLAGLIWLLSELVRWVVTGKFF